MYANRTFRAARSIPKTTTRHASSSAFSPSAHPFLWATVAAFAGVGSYQVLVAPRNGASSKSNSNDISAFRAAQEARARAGQAGAALLGDKPEELKQKVSAAAGTANEWLEAQERTLQRIAAKAKGTLVEKKAFTGLDQGFVDLELATTEDVNHNTKLLRFKLPEDDMVSGLSVASAILTKFKGPDDAKPTLRPYTPVNSEDAEGYLDLLVKKYPDGPMSTHIHSLKPGDKLSFKGPLPKYAWSPNKHTEIGLIAGGTGITPMYQLIRAIFSDKSDKTSVTLVFGNISEPDILLKRELEELENTFPRRFRVFYTLDTPPKDWTGGVGGHINKELLQRVLPGPKEAKDGDVKIFVCGPPGMYKAISGMKKSPKDQGELDGVLKELGYASEQVYKF